MRRPCMTPGCPFLIPKGEQYCTQHRKKAEQRDAQRRGTASQRGYDRTWHEASRPYLKRHPYCERHLEQGRGQVRSTIVGHRIALRDGGERMNPTNWIALCVSCNTKQSHDDGAYSKSKAQATVW